MDYNIIEFDNNKNLFKFENKIIIFNFLNYFNFLLKGYSNKNEIENQFIIDSLRNYIKYNNYKIKDIYRFNKFLKNKYNYNLLRKIYIISSQTLFSYIYKLFFDILPDDYYLCELEDKYKNIKEIKIYFKSNITTSIDIYKCMKILYLDDKNNNDIIYLIFIFNIDLNNDDYLYCNIKYFVDINKLINFYKNI